MGSSFPCSFRHTAQHIRQSHLTDVVVPVVEAAAPGVAFRRRAAGGRGFRRSRHAVHSCQSHHAQVHDTGLTSGLPAARDRFVTGDWYRQRVDRRTIHESSLRRVAHGPISTGAALPEI
jgi:hypothetical protein